MSPSSLNQCPENQTEAAEVALALCNLGSDCTGQKPVMVSNGSSPTPSPTMSLNKLAAAACFYLPPEPNLSAFPLKTTAPPSNPRPHYLRTVSAEETESPPKASHAVPIRQNSHLDISARRAKKNDVKHRRKRHSKNEDTSVSFAEMTRLMNTYGPIKCLRNRTSKNPSKEIKDASILRKFYRWFPDFEGKCHPSLALAYVKHAFDSSIHLPFL